MVNSYSRDAVNANWYYQKYPDVLDCGLSAEEHYSAHGKSEGRFANPLAEELFKSAPGFDAIWYLERYVDVDPKTIDPLLHYVLYGRSEGRHDNQRAETLAMSAIGFDADWYYSMYPDVASANVDALAHYVQFGRFEGRAKSREDHEQIVRIRFEPFIRELYTTFLDREPSEAEISEKVGSLAGDDAYTHILRSIAYSPEAEKNRTHSTRFNKSDEEELRRACNVLSPQAGLLLRRL